MNIPDLNAEGRAAVLLTEEQKYEFDTRGWLLVPGALAEEECAAMREYAYRLRREPESLRRTERSPASTAARRSLPLISRRRATAAIPPGRPAAVRRH